MTPPPDLKPCPFCGSENAPEEMRIGTCFVRCSLHRGGCGTEGPTDTTLAAAVRTWNLRAGGEQ